MNLMLLSNVCLSNMRISTILKSLLVVVPLAIAIFFTFKQHDYYSSQDVVIVDSKAEVDSRADYIEALGAFKNGDLQKAAELDWKAIQVKDVSDELRSSELLLMGSITMSMNRVDIAANAFAKVINMKNAPQEDKKVARQSIATIMMMLTAQAEAEQAQEEEHHGHHSEPKPDTDAPPPGLDGQTEPPNNQHHYSFPPF